MCQYRAVGHPIATAVTEGLVELAAAKIGMDPLEIRRRNLIADDAHPSQGPSGIKYEALSNHEALAHLDAMMKLCGAARRAGEVPQAGHLSRLRLCELCRGDQSKRGVLWVGGARISAQDGATVRLDSTGAIFCTPASANRARVPKP